MKSLQRFERILLVAGDQNSGKSTQLRAMFLDPRFGTNGHGRVPETYQLSPNRCLYLRLSSPQEMKQTPSNFLNKIQKKIQAKAGKLGESRWNFACAMQVWA